MPDVTVMTSSSRRVDPSSAVGVDRDALQARLVEIGKADQAFDPSEEGPWIAHCQDLVPQKAE
jgi:hypothetical protein